MQPAITVARLLSCQMHQRFSQPGVAVRPWFVPIARPLHLQQLADRALAQPELGRDERHVSSKTGKLQPFFRITAFSASPCRLSSATSNLRRRFSSYIAFSRCASLTSSAELLLPAIERRRADPMLTTQVRRLHPSLMLLQYPDDLLFRLPALLHAPLPRSIYERTPASTGRDFRGQVKAVLDVLLVEQHA